MDEDYKFLLVGFSILALVIIICVSINVGTDHSCKTKAITAGMKAQEVREACK